MRGLQFLIAIVLLSLASSAVLAANVTCQYYDLVNVTKNVSTVITYGGVAADDALSLGPVIYKGNSTPCWFEANLSNVAPLAIKAHIFYNVTLFNASVGRVVQEDVSGAIIPGRGVLLLSKYYPEATSCRFDPQSLHFSFLPSPNANLVPIAQNATERVCRDCLGEACRDDGARCTLNTQCGSALCIDGLCVNDCSGNLRRCGEACVKVGALASGTTYQCEFQCDSGIGTSGVCDDCRTDSDCDRGVCGDGRCVEYFDGRFACDLAGRDYVPCETSKTCVLKSSKQEDAPYSCVEECASGFGDDGVCQAPPKERALRVGAILVVICALVLGLFFGIRWQTLERASRSWRVDNAKLRMELRGKDEAMRIVDEEKQRLASTLSDARHELTTAKADVGRAKDKIDEREQAVVSRYGELVEKTRHEKDEELRRTLLTAERKLEDAAIASEKRYREMLHAAEHSIIQKDSLIAKLEVEARQARREAEALRQRYETRR